MLAADLEGIATKVAELHNVVVIGSGSALSLMHVRVMEVVDAMSLSMVACEPCAFDYYDEWRYEEANLPVPQTLPGVYDGSRQYLGKAPWHGGKDLVSQWL